MRVHYYLNHFPNAREQLTYMHLKSQIARTHSRVDVPDYSITSTHTHVHTLSLLYDSALNAVHSLHLCVQLTSGSQ